MRAISNQIYTLEEYFELERNSEEKWEFWDGHVWCMSGASIVHEDIVANTLKAFGKRLDDCFVSGSNVRVKVPIYPPYRYPDLTIVCGSRDIETVSGLEMLLNPEIIIEVLSPSTEAFDRGSKFTYYKSIPSFREYILISVGDAYVTQFFKSSEDKWINQDVTGIASVLRLHSFNVEVPLSEIYRRVVFPPKGFVHPESDRSLQGR